MIAPGTIGMIAPRTAKPRPCSASQTCTPPPASRPNAEPPGRCDGVDQGHRVGDVEQRAPRGAGAAAADIDRRHGRGRIEHHRRDAGRQRRIASACPTRTPAISVSRFYIPRCPVEYKMNDMALLWSTTSEVRA